MRRLQAHQEATGITVAEQVRRSVEHYFACQTPLGVAEILYESKKRADAAKAEAAKMEADRAKAAKVKKRVRRA